MSILLYIYKLETMSNIWPCMQLRLLQKADFFGKSIRHPFNNNSIVEYAHTDENYPPRLNYLIVRGKKPLWWCRIRSRHKQPKLEQLFSVFRYSAKTSTVRLKLQPLSSAIFRSPTVFPINKVLHYLVSKILSTFFW